MFKEDLDVSVRQVRVCRCQHFVTCLAGAAAILGLLFFASQGRGTEAAENQQRKPVADSQPQSAAAAAQSKCDAGEASACFSLGEMYRDGKGVGKDVAKAVNLFVKACDGSLAEACDELRRLYTVGKEVGKDEARAAGFHARAVALWEAGCERQDLKQCVSLGDDYNYSGDKNDKPKAAAAYGKACAAGMFATCIKQGRVFKFMFTEESYKLAVESFRKACDGGETEACGDLGAMYQSGWGVPQDLALAARLFIKGCESGSGIWGLWCTRAGVLYGRGEGVAKDNRIAFDLFKKGCETKDPDSAACVNLAGYYEEGEIVPKDLEKARKLYGIGCADKYLQQQINEEACKKLKELSP
jgi:TPR repeat protein